MKSYLEVEKYKYFQLRENETTFASVTETVLLELDMQDCFQWAEYSKKHETYSYLNYPYCVDEITRTSIL